MPKIYKYLNPRSAKTLLFDSSNIGIKCTPLDEYNDPYEFFAPVNFEDSRNPEEFTFFYQSLKDEIAGSLASCFTITPTNIPMWAHYAEECSGFVLEFDTERIKAAVENLGIHFVLNKVTYRDGYDEGLAGTLGHACATGKGRHEAMARNLVWETAYFTKKTSWEYENEQRLLVPRTVTKSINIGQKEIYILPIPFHAVTSIIAGPKMDISSQITLEDHARKIGTSYFEMRIGRTVYEPFFIAPGPTIQGKRHIDQTFIFDGSSLVECNEYCIDCNEPTDQRKDDSTYCLWCEMENRTEEDF